MIGLEAKKININELISILKQAATEEDKFHAYGINTDNSSIMFGEFYNGFILNSYEIVDVSKENLCQVLYDAIYAVFSDNIIPGNIADIGGNLEYFLEIGENVVLTFPTGTEYSSWINNQVEKESKKR